MLTLFGEIRVARWTAHCRRCGAWVGAVEELLDVTHGMTAAAASAVAAARVTLPFEQAQNRPMFACACQKPGSLFNAAA